MPASERFKTIYPGVFYTIGISTTGRPERIYNIRYRKNGRLIEEKAGRQFQDNMTPAQAARIRSARIEGDELSNQERRKKERAERIAAEGRWTIGKLADSYFESRPDNKARKVDTFRYQKFLADALGKKEPAELLPLDVERIRIKLLRTKSPQTVKHVLNVLTWIVNYGVKNGLCPNIAFRIKKPTVYNQTTEDLTQEQLKRLLAAIDTDPNIQIANMMRLILNTGMRRGECFKLKWADIDFDRRFITIKDPKGGPDQHIPLNDSAFTLLSNHPRTANSDYVFPGVDGKQRQSAQQAVNKIKKAAGLPKNFRPLHGLRHLFATMLASSGKVDMYQLQRLLTHKDPRMTQRYAHLRDAALRKASEVAGEIIAKASEKPAETQEIMNLGGPRK